MSVTPKDDMVLAVQKWLNATYGGVSGWTKVPENGTTGWNTVYGLLHGLQHEFSLEMVDNFGPATESAFDNIASGITPGKFNGNIAQIIQGGFWAKGINPGGFDGKYSTETQEAFEKMQKNAGFTSPDGVWKAMWMKPLCDMSQFTLIQGGDSRIRTMQQDLNNKLHKYTGILPCDGFYQRETNTALIYGLQVAIGLGDIANGVYGPGTVEKCPTLMTGKSGDVVKILQYGLYVNKVYTGAFDGVYDGAVGASVHAFRKIMNLDPVDSEVAPNRVMKGLLTSNGDTSRDSIACDTSRQLTATDVTNFKNYGFSIVGRYLTGTVGSGVNETPKNLTNKEIKLITDGGLSIFAIYQDGGAQSGYFTNSRGYNDGLLAVSAARTLGFKNDTVIYFACDIDLLEGEIGGTIIPYMQGVNSALTAGGRFRAGIYGTRNVAQHVIDAGLAEYAFVSNMSTGYSGNLGYPMATPWAFDQFIEYPIAGTPIDQVAVNDNTAPHDAGCTTFTPGEITEEDKRTAVAELMSGTVNDIFAFKWDYTYSISTGSPTVTITWKAKISQEREKAEGTKFTVDIKDGKILKTDLTAQMQNVFGGYDTVKLGALIDERGITEVTSKVASGKLTTSCTVTPSSITIEFEVDVFKMKSMGDLEVNVKIYETVTYNHEFWEQPEFATVPVKNRLSVAGYNSYELLNGFNAWDWIPMGLEFISVCAQILIKLIPVLLA